MSASPLRRLGAALVVLVALVRLAAAAAAQVCDEWRMVRMDAAKVGFEHVVVENVQEGGKAGGRPLWKTTTDSSMTLNRLNTNITMTSMSWELETAEGDLLEMHFEMNASVQNTVTHVKVDGKRATVTKSAGGPVQTTLIDWNPAWRGHVANDRFERTQIAAGTADFTYPAYTAELGEITSHLTLLGRKKVAVPGAADAELLQVRQLIEERPELSTDQWRDERNETVMTVVKTMGMSIITTNSDKAECLAAFANPDTPELFDKLMPRSNVRLPDPYHCDQLVLHIKAADPAMPLPKLEDERQHVVKQIAKDELLLEVKRVTPDRTFTLPLSDFTPEEKECLEPNVQIESDFPGIVALAKQEVAGESDAWKAAGKLEKLTDTYISNKGYKSLFWTAKDVFEKKSGDCSEHGVFLAALCRAVGIPARVACGFLYYQGIWGGHMWAEVSLGGKWYALDGTLGHGSVDAGHLRLGADSLKSSQIERVFSGVALGMTMKIDLVSFRHGDQEIVVGESGTNSETDGARFRDRIYRFSLVAPDGYRAEPNQNITLGDNRVVTLKSDGGPEIGLDVIDVPYDFKLDDVKSMLQQKGMGRLKASEREIAGLAGRLFRGKADGKQVVVATLLRDGTLYVVGIHLEEGQSEAAFEALLGSLVFDAGK